jgi:hypothetical protein
MAAEQYFIVLHNNEWKISFKEKLYGPFATQGEAIEAALEAAYAMGDIGIDAQVLVEEADHKLRTEWAYGQSLNTIRWSSRRDCQSIPVPPSHRRGSKH